MAENSKIEWCDATFNPWIGCTKVSPACDHCYAARQDAHRKWTPEGWGGPRRRTSAELWKGPTKWAAQPFVECMGCRWRGEAREGVLRDGLPGFDRDPGAMRCCPKCQEPLLKEARRRVFCASLADWLDNEVPIEWLVDLLDLVRRTPELDWLLLSKRIGNWRKRLEEAHQATVGKHTAFTIWLTDWLIRGLPPAHVWIMATICNQTEADRDVAKLLAVPARVRGLSIEPMLGPITLPAMRCDRGSLPGPGGAGGVTCPDCNGHGDRGDRGCMRLHWVIGGFESGPHARPGNPVWACSLRNQCAKAGAAFLWKQNGEWLHEDERGADGRTADLLATDKSPLHQWPDGAHSVRVGKAAAGRLLDGVTHDGFPR